ncbi:MAG: NADH-quinone oxidoreductase subunit NuoF [Kiritimatiellae bacterium]|nr:NADH-quinone oxidoreductase subunit NuoF [Kiritimatiellia bacterium]
MAYSHFVLVCAGTACDSCRSREIYNRLNAAVRTHGLEGRVQVVRTGCFGFCAQGPVVKVLPDESLYVQVRPEDADEIVAEHLAKGRPVQRLLYGGARPGSFADIPFYQKQFRIVLRNCGIIDPENIEEYIAREGYEALAKVLTSMTPDDVIAELRTSGLRGRGGAGYPTWKKWVFTKNASADTKYVICNADEGDPGAYMDRSTLEGDPHSVLEAMAIAGYAVGAHQGYIYIRAEYPLAIHRLEIAIRQAREMGLLGRDILGTGFDFDVELRLGAGAFVCGEETALIASIEGKRGMPVPRPPYPAVRGLWGRPTVINNVETFANIPVIILKGGAWFASIGTETSKGTKVFALTGKVNNSGLIEVPMGTTLREIIFDIGGGIKGGRRFKAAQTGGPSGGVIPEQFLDTPIDYESLAKLGSIMGSGGLIVMDEDDCIVDVNKFYLEFTVDESCGKCAPCRIGGRTMFNLLTDITEGRATVAHIEQIHTVAHAMQKASLCGLGQTAPNPVLSSLRYFGEEYRVHIKDKRCPAGRCRALVTYTILPDKCIGCTLCARRCPVNCISGERRKPHVIDLTRCIKCGECFAACKFGAVLRT